jgi:FAD/FMN-containing dehydrogenase
VCSFKVNVYRYSPDPSSNPSIGGMASTGGSGMSTLKYGTSKENIRSMVVGLALFTLICSQNTR